MPDWPLLPRRDSSLNQFSRLGKPTEAIESGWLRPFHLADLSALFSNRHSASCIELKFLSPLGVIFERKDLLHSLGSPWLGRE